MSDVVKTILIISVAFLVGGWVEGKLGLAKRALIGLSAATKGEVNDVKA
jgi:hypothetical protein